MGRAWHHPPMDALLLGRWERAWLGGGGAGVRARLFQATLCRLCDPSCCVLTPRLCPCFARSPAANASGTSRVRGSMRFGSIKLGDDTSLGHDRAFWRCLACVTERQAASVLEAVGSFDMVDGFGDLSAEGQAQVLTLQARLLADSDDDDTVGGVDDESPPVLPEGASGQALSPYAPLDAGAAAAAAMQAVREAPPESPPVRGGRAKKKEAPRKAAVKPKKAAISKAASQVKKAPKKKKAATHTKKGAPRAPSVERAAGVMTELAEGTATKAMKKAKEKSVLIRARRMPRTWPDYVMVAASALATRRTAVSEPKLYKFVAEEFPASVEGRKEAHCKKFLKKALAKLTEEGELKRVKNSYVLAC